MKLTPDSCQKVSPPISKSLGRTFQFTRLDLALSWRQSTGIRIKVVRAATNAEPHSLAQLAAAPDALVTFFFVHGTC
jgi:hypothetical protein